MDGTRALRRNLPLLQGIVVWGLALLLPGLAFSLPITTTESENYMIIGNGPVNDVGVAVGIGVTSSTSNFEIGANKAPVPSTSDRPGCPRR